MADEESVRICKEMLACKDYYQILGVSKDASEAEIKKAYKKKSLKVHPDKNKAPEAQEAFKRLSQAYVTLSDEGKKRQYDMCGSEEEFLRTQQGAGQSPFQHMDPEEIFREMFAGGGLPPEFAHIFGAAMGGQRMGGRRGGRGPDLFDVLGGGFPGGGATFTFTSMGPGGRTTFYSSGGGRRREQPQNIEEELRRRQQQQGPQSITDWCVGMFRQCFYIMFMMQVFLGVGPGYLISLVSYFLSSEANIDRWNFSMKVSNSHTHEMKTDLFESSFFLPEKEYDSLNLMKMERPEMYSEFNKNMENHIYKETKRECSEAQFEQKRLRQRARYFNHRPEKAQEILIQAESVPGLIFCDQQERLEDLLRQNNQ